MENQIIQQIANPAALEQLYRSNPSAFTRAFHTVYPQISSEISAKIWHERLAVSSTSWGSKGDWVLLIFVASLAAFFMQFPDIFSLSHDRYFPRNMSFFVMPGIGAYFAYKQGLTWRELIGPLLILIASAVFINLLPEKSTTLLLTSLHIPLLSWLVVGYIFAGSDSGKRMDFLRYHGDLLVMTVVIVLAGGLFTGLTLSLFGLIQVKIDDFYFRYLVLSALPSVPLFATFLVRQNTSLVSKISPVIARIFTPLVTITLALFLVAIISTGKDPYNDREFLLVFNGILIGVMALILFSLGEATKANASRVHQYFLFALAILAILDNGIALTAIGYRLLEYGVTPNRLAVLGSNIIVMLHLMMVAKRLWGFLKGSKSIEEVELGMTIYLPIYAIWAAIVSFLFPLIFQFS
ncbi:hypothetical protein SKC37_06985 [Aquirufa sp. HETE-83D]|uniref:DUF4153 domain-containing protein n=1 Tax=Aquirufa esocilacus TaxID=3096513 RepID=A0ABW6DLK2_9BACT